MLQTVTATLQSLTRHVPALEYDHPSGGAAYLFRGPQRMAAVKRHLGADWRLHRYDWQQLREMAGAVLITNPRGGADVVLYFRTELLMAGWSAARAAIRTLDQQPEDSGWYDRIQPVEALPTDAAFRVRGPVRIDDSGRSYPRPCSPS